MTAMLKYVLIVFLGVNPATGQKEVIVEQMPSIEACENTLTIIEEKNNFSVMVEKIGGLVAGCFVQD